MKRIFLLLSILYWGISITSVRASSEIKILLLSGNNNHDWKTTTPFIKEVLENNKSFSIDITNNPETMNKEMLKKYDVIVSNWNSLPQETGVWSEDTRNALMDFIQKGKGFVTLHGASAAHYDWPFFLELTGGRWGKKTNHGPIITFKVSVENQKHPITKGLKDFTYTDELWIDLEMSSALNYEFLCTATTDEKPEKKEPIALITKVGKGRGFYLVLGHDVSTMNDPNWKALLLRGTEWAAKGKVK